ncbi:unnamed protein product (macronuclear) [Paramecium tetraurelia]|uniref:HSF-type DNA-binding domain-containing protein n=1 Tax=Paramecium tetraurelia TaxID=5888 RepID=A0CB65_PARTE|nr:uncharacterized protein GSPATT00036815001 [Paramecium tetraurelia]CAK68032.1 unnamed protein product [Paramecium tetraurelia]|eukprot:XP_001435429.1 hypothetical protein (macronuclear) [Paramecium tetraurelia strain d4-2]
MTNQQGPFSTPAFIIKLYDMLDEQVFQYDNTIKSTPQFQTIIKWSDDGEYLIVVNPKEMESQILPQYFKHNHYQSFLRQLNMYEFQKARNSENHEIFTHPNFKKGCKKQLSLIKRNPIKQKVLLKKDKKNAKVESTEVEFEQQMEQELTFLKQRQHQFENDFKAISEQNQIIMEQHNSIWSQLSLSRQSLDAKIDRLSYLLSFFLKQQDTSIKENNNEQDLFKTNVKIEFEPSLSQTQQMESLSPILRMMQQQLNYSMKKNLSTFSPNQLNSPLPIRSQQENQDSQYSNLSPLYQKSFQDYI